MPPPDFQDRVGQWADACFGSDVATDPVERNARFIEEALELVQSLGMSKHDVLTLVDYVFSRPIGDPPQEVGGVMITLAGLCRVMNLNMTLEGEIELSRVWSKINVIRRKHETKPRNSPLPIKVAA